ncbi:GNAT family N-acetyltransferase [Streptomonospora salina]|uniref:Putative GNAT family N-acyltransferase n=1 Tax=Streptomonospora salina TaxID=104205 RepID=A0A841E6C3_9ACTN|nr:GNAT family N-acetyltransferase [Streptomonospora salina]MBB5996728.1 putative GNAT family N-acyltransferase [Streptomonospora salina]
MRTIDLAESREDRAAVFVIRGAVFVAEQQVPVAEEWDSRDLGADHLLARIDGVPAGTGRLVVEGGRGVLGRLAVLPEARGTGTGAALVGAVEERARKLGSVEMELHAQTRALGLYERLGYTARGEEFLDAGIRHRDMRRRLD